MEPTLKAGDLAVVRRSAGYRPGEVVAFSSPIGTVIHRIVDGSPDEGFVLKGDNRTTPDPFRASPDELQGKLWLRVPMGGLFLSYLKRPLNVLMMVVALAGLLLLGWEGRRLKQRGGLGKLRGGSRSGSSLAHLFLLLPVTAGVFVTAGLLFLAATVWGFQKESSRLVRREWPLYSHEVRLSYTAEMEPSTLYPDGLVGPVSVPQGRQEASPPLPLYTRLARGLRATFAYRFSSPDASSLSGEAGAEVVLEAGQQGWRKQLVLLPPESFAGPSVGKELRIDLTQVFALISEIERETGVRAPWYELRIVPLVRLRGEVSDRRIDDFFSPAFVFKIDPTQVSPESTLVKSQVTTATREERRKVYLGLAGWQVSVERWRQLSLTSLACALTLAASAAAAAVVLARRRPTIWLTARYRGLVVDLAAPAAIDDTTVIDVASFGDLVRLARLKDTPVLHYHAPDGGDIFLLRDGMTSYRLLFPAKGG